MTTPFFLIDFENVQPKALDRLKPGTRALYLNSPNNPTGWTVIRPELEAILERRRNRRHHPVALG